MALYTFMGVAGTQAQSQVMRFNFVVEKSLVSWLEKSLRQTTKSSAFQVSTIQRNAKEK